MAETPCQVIQQGRGRWGHGQGRERRQQHVAAPAQYAPDPRQMTVVAAVGHEARESRLEGERAAEIGRLLQREERVDEPPARASSSASPAA